MLATILFSFMVYGIYQPAILTELGFGGLASQWGILQGALGFLVEPGLGSFSDRILTRTGSRLPQIVVGVTLAGALFVVLSLLVPPPGQMPLEKPSSLRWVILAMMILWLMAMIAIRGPMVAMLRQMAPVEQLPIANGLIILVIGLVSALGPLLGGLLQRQSAAIAFLLGAIALMVGAARLYQTTYRHLPPWREETRQFAPSPWQYRQRLGLILVVGIETGSLLNLALNRLPEVVHSHLPTISPGNLTAISLFTAALAANPWEGPTMRWGAARALQIGLGAVGSLLLLSYGVASAPVAVGLLLATGMAMGLVLISMVPFALSRVPLPLAGLSTGLFFGGNSLGATLVLLWIT
jgi:MFS family permease